MGTTVSTPTGTNTAAGVANTVASDVVSAAETAAETLFFADFPYLALPGLKQLIQLGFSFVASYLSKGVQQIATDGTIIVQVGSEVSSFNQALAALKAAQASGDANAIATALAAFQVAAQNLGHSDGSAPAT